MTGEQRAEVARLFRCAAERTERGCSIAAPLTDACPEAMLTLDRRRVLATARQIAGEMNPSWLDQAREPLAAFLREAAFKVEVVGT